MKIVLGFVGIAIAAAAAWYLGKEGGYDGGYFDEFIAFIAVQLMFVGGACLAMWGFGIFQVNYLYVAIGASFVCPMVGRLVFVLPGVRNNMNGKKLRSAIMKGKKYQSFSAFMREKGDRVGGVRIENGQVFFTPDGIEIFSRKDNGYEVETTWTIGNPAFGWRSSDTNQPGWQSRVFFGVAEDERKWTWEEQQILKELIKEALPRNAEGWSEYEGVFYRNLPKVMQKKKRNNPY